MKLQKFNPIFLGSSFLVFFVVAYTILSPNFLETLTWIQNIFVVNMSWFYVLIVFCLLCFCIYLILSPYGQMRLGSLDRPKYSTFTWIAMLFSAGMGTGLLFSGVYEPLHHYIFPPTGLGSSSESLNLSFQLTFLNWGFSGWIVYTCMGLVFSYFCLYKKFPFRISCMLYPFLKEKIHGPIGWCIDIFSITAILFGVATSLGRGALQINSGLKHLFDFPFSSNIQIGIIVIITLLATLSVLSGLNRGIRRLSEINIVLCFSLLVFIFVTGPSVFIFNSFIEHSGAYLQNLISNMTRTHSLGSAEWRSSWTILYLAWWIAWAPFVGLFIAKISEGRTIREFVIYSLFVPSALSFLWFTVFGGTAIDYHIKDIMNLEPFLKTEYPILIFKFLEHFPFSSAASLITLVAVSLFFITSSDSASYVIHNMSSYKKNITPINKIYWSSLEGLIALVILFFGGIKSLELLVIITSFPLTLLICLICYGFLKEISKSSGSKMKKVSKTHSSV